MNDRQFYEDDDILLDFGKIIHNLKMGICKSWHIAFILAVFFAIATAIFFNITYTPIYKVTASFTVATTVNSDNQSSEEDDDEYAFNYNRYTASLLSDTFPYILNSGAMQDVLKKEMNTDTINGTITATAIENTNIFTVEVESNSAQDAYDIMNAIITDYPKIAKYVIGNTKLNIILKPVMPKAPDNLFHISNYLLIGALIGIGIWAFALIIYAFLRNTIYRETDIQEQLNINLFGSLPVVRKQRRNKSSFSDLKPFTSDNGFYENVNTITTRILNHAKKTGDKLFLITSTSSGEGKSTIIINLAMALEQRGYSVLLIDADLYQNMLPQYLNCKEEHLRGLIDFFEEKASEKEITYFCEKLNCDLIAGNRKTECPTEIIFNSEKIAALLKEVKEKYDYVLIDTPPCGILSDAAELSQYADAAIFIIQRDKESVAQILETMQNLYDSGIRISGCILNGAERSEKNYKQYGYGK